MKEIQRNNKYFIKFDNLHEIYEELCSLLDNSKIFEETNKILLHIPLKEINLELNEKEKNEKEKIEELYSIISNYNKEIEELKKNIKEELKKNINIINENKNKEIEELKKNINEINNINENKNKEIEELKGMIKRNEENIKPLIEYKNKKNENLIINNLESIIIKENEEYNKRLKKWICPYKNIKMKGELLYRLSKDGKEYETFHKKCDNRGETLILIKINENLIIGGYTSLNWDSSSKWKKDNNTFIFSLTHNKKYIKNNDNSNSIYCLNSFGPMFDNLGFDENKSMKEFKFNPQNSFLYSYEIFPDIL